MAREESKGKGKHGTGGRREALSERRLLSSGSERRVILRSRERRASTATAAPAHLATRGGERVNERASEERGGKNASETCGK